jgi:hypothetical protein
MRIDRKVNPLGHMDKGRVSGTTDIFLHCLNSGPVCFLAFGWPKPTFLHPFLLYPHLLPGVSIAQVLLGIHQCDQLLVDSQLQAFVRRIRTHTLRPLTCGTNVFVSFSSRLCSLPLSSTGEAAGLDIRSSMEQSF